MLTDLLDRERCGAAFNPHWPYLCALPLHEGEHVHFGQSCAWPRQPDYPPDFTEEWLVVNVVPGCSS